MKNRKSKSFRLTCLLALLPVLIQAQIPMPVRIGGTLTVNGTQVTYGTADTYEFRVVRENGEAFDPPAVSTGLNNSDWYVVDIPICHETAQPGGAAPDSTAKIEVYKNSVKLDATTPAGGTITIGQAGSLNQINLVAEGGAVVSLFAVTPPGVNWTCTGWVNNAIYPWVWHFEQGWWYDFPISATESWVWDLQAGWFYINCNGYPWLYSVNRSCWLWYYENPAAPANRWFSDACTGQTFSIPKSE